MNHLQAKALVDSLIKILPEESLVIRGISLLETGYGNWTGEGAGSNNMGAVTGVGPAGSFQHKDSKPDGMGGVIEYVTSFRKYVTPLQGFTDVRNIALKPNVRTAIQTGSLRGVSAAMFANHYYTGVQSTPDANINAHAKRLIQCITDITVATGEPNPFMPVTQEPELKAPLPKASDSGSPSSGLPDSSSTLRSVLRLGSTGPDVRVWQALVNTTVDGRFGPTTEAATRHWQFSNGLTPDGIVGKLTWQKAEPLLGSGLQS